MAYLSFFLQGMQTGKQIFQGRITSRISTTRKYAYLLFLTVCGRPQENIRKKQRLATVSGHQALLF